MSKSQVRSQLEHSARIVDLGCKLNAWEEAGTAVDIDDYSSYYQSLNPPKEFIQSDANCTPFEDKAFDFSVASHIIEHVEDPRVFIEELTRISQGGYIEFPTPVFDNLTRGNEVEHKWFVRFDDKNRCLIFTPKVQLIPALFTVRDAGFLNAIFPDDMVTSVVWNDSIEFEIR